MNIKDLEMEFTHTAGELELILAGLRKLPMELVQELHTKIINLANQKVADHVAANAQATPETPAETPEQ